MSDREGGNGVLGPEIRVCGLTGKAARFQTTYCIRLHPRLKRQLGIASMCVVSSRRPQPGVEIREGLVRRAHVEEDDGLARYVGLSPPDGRLRAIATVIVSNDVPPNELQVDETLRTALAISMDEAQATNMFEIEILPLVVPAGYRLKNFLGRTVGYRHMYARVGAGFVADIDKPVGRIPAFAFPLLGISDGGGVVCETAIREKAAYRLKELPLRVYSMSPEIQAEREAKEADPAQRRFRSSSKILRLTNELPHIYIGHDLRERLDSGDLDAIRVRRSVTHVLFQETVNFGVVASLSGLATIQTLIAMGVPNIATLLLGSVLSLVLPAILIIVRVRGTIR